MRRGSAATAQELRDRYYNLRDQGVEARAAFAQVAPEGGLSSAMRYERWYKTRQSGAEILTRRPPASRR